MLINFIFIILTCCIVLLYLWKLYSNYGLTIGNKFVIFFSIEHLLITIVFAFFLNKFESINDPQRFFSIAYDSSDWFSLFGLGNEFMSFIVYPLVKLGLTIETLFFLFSVFGLFGFFILFSLINVSKSTKLHFNYLFFLLPSIHLWTSSLSKEPLLLLFISILVSALCKSKKRTLLIILCLLFIFLVRPHVFFVLVLVLMSTYLYYDFNFKLKRDLIFLIGTVTVSAGLLYVALIYFMDWESFNVNYLLERYQNFVKLSSDTGNAGISLTETNLLERIGYILFMPLPLLYQPKNLFQLIASLENILYVVFVIVNTIFFIKNYSNLKSIFSKKVQFFMVVSSFLLMLMFASYLYNMGLGSRMRIMFYPILFIYLLSFHSFDVHKKSS